MAAPVHCAGAKTKIEKAICSSPELRKRDKKIAEDYKWTYNFLTGDNHNTLRLQQKNWLAQRDHDCADASYACLLKAYQERQDQLDILETRCDHYGMSPPDAQPVNIIDLLQFKGEWKVTKVFATDAEFKPLDLPVDKLNEWAKKSNLPSLGGGVVGAPGNFYPYSKVEKGNIRVDDEGDEAGADYPMILAETGDSPPSKKFVADVLHVEPSAKWFTVLFISLKELNLSVRKDHSVVVWFIFHRNDNYTLAELPDRGFQIWTPLTPDAGIYDALNRRYVAP